MNNLISFIQLAGLIILNAIFVSAEYAILATSKIRVADLAQQGDQTAKLMHTTLSNPNKQNRYISTSQICISVISLALGMVGEGIFSNWLLILFAQFSFANALAHTIATILATILLTIVQVVIGEMIPKTLTIQNAEAFLRLLIRPMNFLEKILSPLVFLLNKGATFATSILGIKKLQSNQYLSDEEIEYIVEESSDKGIIESVDEILIENIFDLKERTAEMVMTPRPNIIGISKNADFEEIKQAINQGRTRYPVFHETIDNIIGFIHVKDVGQNKLALQNDGLQEKFIREIQYVSEAATISELLQLFKDSNIQVAVVIDEFGGTAGLVTLEDLMEEVVGEIKDEFDIDEERPFHKLNENQFRVRGDLPLEEFEQLHNISLHSEYANTLAGYLMEKTGKVLSEGDTLKSEGYKFIVDKMDNLAAKTVIIEIIKKE
jgi:CBS domain containing-hemolysin-like protein